LRRWRYAREPAQAIKGCIRAGPRGSTGLVDKSLRSFTRAVGTGLDLSLTAVLPLLEDSGQDARVEHDARGRPTRTIHHMPKLFLIDARGIMREIYCPLTAPPYFTTRSILRHSSVEPTFGLALGSSVPTNWPWRLVQ
jgi:hypothetical protein